MRSDAGTSGNRSYEYDSSEAYTETTTHSDHYTDYSEDYGENFAQVHVSANRRQQDQNRMTKDHRVWDETAKEAFTLMVDVMTSHLRWSLDHFETAYASK